MFKGLVVAIALIAASGGGPASAQMLGGLLEMKQGLATTPVTEPGSLGITFTDRPGAFPVIESLDPAGPAAAAGLQPGDAITLVRLSPRDFWAGNVGGYISGETINTWVRRYKVGTGMAVSYSRSGGEQREVKLTTGPQNASPAMQANAVEEARTAYLKMCGKGAEKLSAATCEGMRRDLDLATAARAASRREAEVMGVYRQLCAPGAAKLSAETCASMLAEAKRSLVAPASVAREAATKEPAARAAAPKAGGRAELGDAYQELCAPGAQQVSAETCAALKADAAPAPAPTPVRRRKK